MIETEQQYQITCQQKEAFEKALERWRTEQPDPTMHPRLWNAQGEALQSEYEELLAEMMDYENENESKKGRRLSFEEIKKADIEIFDNFDPKTYVGPDPLKTCMDCLREFPANFIYFARSNKTLKPRCKPCHRPWHNNNERKRTAFKRLHETGQAFRRHTVFTDNILAELAGPPPASEPDPHICASCGNKKGNMIRHVDLITEEKYGHLCARCNKLLIEYSTYPECLRGMARYLEEIAKKSSTQNGSKPL